MGKLPKYITFLVRSINKGTGVEMVQINEADVEEVVRCIDCKYHFKTYGSGANMVVECTRYKRAHSAKWYCADGRRSDG